MSTISLATPGDCQRGGAEVGEGSDGGGKDHGKQPLRSSAKASLHDEDDGKGWVRLTDLMNFRKSSKRLLTPPPSFSESYIALFATKL